VNLKLTVRSKISDLFRSINDFLKGYQPRTNRVSDEKGDLVTESHSILATWRIHFSQLFDVNGVNDFRQTDIHTAEPIMPETCDCLRRRSAVARLLRLQIRIPPGQGCMSLVSVVCCLVEVPTSDRSLVQRSPTECG
jgi:hypothetical protein